MAHAVVLTCIDNTISGSSLLEPVRQTGVICDFVSMCRSKDVLFSLNTKIETQWKMAAADTNLGVPDIIVFVPNNMHVSHPCFAQRMLQQNDGVTGSVCFDAITDKGCVVAVFPTQLHATERSMLDAAFWELLTRTKTVRRRTLNTLLELGLCVFDGVGPVAQQVPNIASVESEAVLLPPIHKEINSKFWQCGQVYLQETMQPIFVSRRWLKNNDGWWVHEDTSEEKLNQLKIASEARDFGKSALFVGTITSHYGHWLLEVLAHLWPLVHWPKNHPLSHIVAFCPEEEFDRAMEMLSFAVWHLWPTRSPPPVSCVKKPTLARTQVMFVASSLVAEAEHPHPLLKVVYQRLSASVVRSTAPGFFYAYKTPLRLFLSRTTKRTARSKAAFATQLEATNEDDIETLFQKDGFLPINCATLPLDQQILLFSKARCIVGRPGTAMHNVVFLPRGASVCVLEDQRRINWTQRVLDDMMHAKVFVVPFQGTTNDRGDITFDCDSYRQLPTRLTSSLTNGS